MKLIGDKTPISNKTFKSITINWPSDTEMPTVHGKWQRMADGRIQAVYDTDELAVCLSIIELIRDLRNSI